jgi:transcriptional regulator with XRE-family HTH domain
MAQSDAEIADVKALGRLLAERRKELGVTQEQAAGLCNVGARFIGEIERGKMTAENGKVLQVIHGYGLQLVAQPRKLGKGSR